MSPRRIALSLVLASAFVGAPALAADPGPDVPLQTRPEKTDDSWMLQGWTANILGVNGEGKTLLVVNGDAGYTVVANIDGADQTQSNPASFTLADKDYRIVVKVHEPKGADWSETVDVPKGMKVTVDVKARYEHRGFEGTIKNDTLGCKATKRKFLKFEIYQNGTMIGNEITLEAGKSAHGVRLKPGQYDLKVFERVGGDYRLLKSAVLDPKEAQWRYDEKCD